MAEVDAIVDAARRTREPVRDLAIVALCIDAGPSRAELAAVRPADLDAGRGLLAIGSGPTRRLVRLGAFALSAVSGALAPADAPHLLMARDGRPLTERTIHEQLLTIGSLAGLGHWVTVRHTRRTFVAAVAVDHDLRVAMRLTGHGSVRYPAASMDEAVRAQFGARWVSPLDRMLAAARERAAA